MLGEEAFERLTSLDIGDLIGVDGAALRSRRGEISLRVDDFEVLAKALRPPPDKHAGLADVETRYRRRELDLIANERRAGCSSIARRSSRRSAPTSTGRASSRPRRRCCSRCTAARWRGRSRRPQRARPTLYLRIATELYLKRLLVGGLERVYELGKDFRNEGVSTKHNPEFTMVEFYEAYADYEVAARRLEELVRAAAAAIAYDGELDFSAPWRRVGFVESIAEATGIDLASGDATSSRCGRRSPRAVWQIRTDGASWAQIADELLSKFVEPTLQPAELRVRLSGRALAVRARAPLRPGWSSAGRRSPAASRSRTRSASSTMPMRSASASRPRGAPASAATRRRSPTTSCSCRRSSRACRRPAEWASGSIGW